MGYLPDNLKRFASPIITKAMATGGRSRSITTTNYGVIGDAFVKKAQLEMDMASLKADMGMKLLEMKTGVEMKKLDMEMGLQKQKTQAVMDAEANKMSDVGKIAATLQGVASGATVGFAAGGPVGAVIGGVAGGAMSAGAAYGPTNRARQDSQEVNGALGSLATSAVALRGMYDGYKGKKAHKDIGKHLGDLAGAIGSTQPGPAQDKLIAEYDSVMASGQATLGEYFNPDEVNSMMQGFRDGSPAYLSNDPVKRAKGQEALLGISAASDERLKADGPELYDALDQYHGKLNQLRGVAYGNPEYQVSPEDFSQWAGGVDPMLGQAVTDKYTGQGYYANPSLDDMSGGNAGSAPSASQTYETPASTTHGTPTDHSADHTPNQPVPTSGFAYTPPVGVAAPSAVVMDDQQAFMNQIEGLNKMGAESAELIKNQQDESGIPYDPHAMVAGTKSDGPMIGENDPVDSPSERLVHGGKVGNVEVPGLLTGKGVAQDKGERPLPGNKTPKQSSTERIRNEVRAPDKEIEKELTHADKYTIDKADKDITRNIRNSVDSINKLEPLVGKALPNDSQAKSAAAKVLIDGLGQGKSIGEMMNMGILMKGNRATLVGMGVLDKVSRAMPGGQGSAKLVSDILSEEEIESVEQAHRVMTMAIPQFVKTTDNSQVTNPEFEQAKDLFFNYGQSADRQMAGLRDMKLNLLDKARNLNKGSEAYYKAQLNQTNAATKYRGDVQIQKAEEEGFRRGHGSISGQAAARDELGIPQPGIKKKRNGFFTIRSGQGRLAQ